jgi:hypothetical protein
MRVKIAPQPFAAQFPPLSVPPPLPLSHFGTSPLNSKFRPLPILSANLCVLGVSALAFLFPRSSPSEVGCPLTADGCPLTPFPRSLTQKQGGTGYWYDQFQIEEAGIKASATLKNEAKREERTHPLISEVRRDGAEVQTAQRVGHPERLSPHRVRHPPLPGKGARPLPRQFIHSPGRIPMCQPSTRSKMSTIRPSAQPISNRRGWHKSQRYIEERSEERRADPPVHPGSAPGWGGGANCAKSRPPREARPT